ncbi:MAG: biliverdin-producing heme oxygenase [Phycisphaeraceae bacterium]|nr:biliverdin-producing heme oxygenase [Phycisphaerales bacterium]MCB9860190.1 biliverdin-producing heme oxygenase [Phycisphaeraceae bacterium]
MTTSDSTAVSLPDMLKAETAERHHIAERHPIQQQLLKGQLSREQFADMLEQMLVVHRAMRVALTALRNGCPAFAPLLHDDFFQDIRLEQDLRFFDRDPNAVVALPETQKIAEHIELLGEAEDEALLGWQYVLEGSNNGNMYIARAVGQSLGLTGHDGLRFLTPHGEMQRPKWQQFRADLAGLQLTDDERGGVLIQACQAFDAITCMMDGLQRFWDN